MQNLTMGANLPLDCHKLSVTLRWPAAVGTLDISVYLLGSDKQVRGDGDMIFFNQPSDPSGGVQIADSSNSHTTVQLDLDLVPVAIENIMICVTVDAPLLTMAAFAGTAICVVADGRPPIGFAPDLAHASEVAMRMIEVYRRDGGWRVRAIGQGFSAGLTALARSFGVDVEDDEPDDRTDQALPVASSLDAASDAVEPTPVFDGEPILRDQPIDLPLAPHIVEDEVAERFDILFDHAGTTLTPNHPSHEWELGGPDAADGQIAVELRWESRLDGAGGRARLLELELGCFFELADGTRGVLQTWDNRGLLDGLPFIRLNPSEMIGGRGRQQMLINASQPDRFKGLTIFAFIPGGSPNWSAAGVALVTTCAGQIDVSTELTEGKNGNAIVAMLDMAFSGNAISLQHRALFAARHSDLDEQLGWDMQWQTRPSPHVH